MKKIRVLIVDDHPMVRQGLKIFLDLCEDIEVVGEASNGVEALQKVEDLTPDVVLMDLIMPVLDGNGVIEELKKRGVESKVLVLTSFAEEELVLKALRSGAVSYIMKDVSPHELTEAIKETSKGVSKLHPEIIKKLIQQVTSETMNFTHVNEKLTEREQQVLGYLAEGLSNKEIAAILQVSLKTIKCHVANILQKMGVSSRTKAALLAVKGKLNN